MIDLAAKESADAVSECDQIDFISDLEEIASGCDAAIAAQKGQNRASTGHGKAYQYVRSYVVLFCSALS